MTLEEIIEQQRKQGKTIIQVHKYLRDNNMSVPFVIVRKLYRKEKK